MFYGIRRVYSVCIVWIVWRGLGQVNELMCCSLGFIGFVRFGVFERGHMFYISSKYNLICFSVSVYSVCSVWIV